MQIIAFERGLRDIDCRLRVDELTMVLLILKLAKFLGFFINVVITFALIICL